MTAYIRARSTQSGQPRFDVRYKLGRYGTTRHAGTYTSHDEARERLGYLRRSLRAGVEPSRPTELTAVWVYFIQDSSGPIKIGVARNVSLRMASLQNANPNELRLLGKYWGTVDAERVLHRRFAHLRIRGEWFEDDPSIHQLIAAVAHA